MSRIIRMLAACCALGAAPAFAKPIAYARGHTVMAEYGGDTMKETQWFYAPRYWWSGGVGWLELRNMDGRFERDLVYGRANWLVKRWNLPAAQANVFAWGSLGAAQGDTFDGTDAVMNAGFQLDYETRRVYAAFKSDAYASEAFTHRIDTLQLGAAPYLHDWDRLATWFVVQARAYTGGIAEGTETAALVRFFKGGTWIEAGVTDDGQVQAMLMLNF
jgi:hypothetical protein